MNMPSDDIISVLPSLRRYACALTGSTQSGDEYIRVALEAVVAEPWRLPSRGDVRRELYSLLHRTLQACKFPDAGPWQPTEYPDDVRDRLLQLSLMDRELLLLVELEGFELDDAADLLGLTASEAEAQLTSARRALRARQAQPARADRLARMH